MRSVAGRVLVCVAATFAGMAAVSVAQTPTASR